MSRRDEWLKQTSRNGLVHAMRESIGYEIESLLEELFDEDSAKDGRSHIELGDLLTFVDTRLANATRYAKYARSKYDELNR